jgi:SAM-dependent methyltransferase
MKPTPNAFGPIAPYYDQLMKPVPYRMWVGYYLLLLSYLGVHPRRVLDVACGTGTMTQMLAREGFKMSGVDISQPMIQVARAKAARARLPIDYFVADASDMDIGEKFDAALSFFDSLNNILEAERLASAFRCIADHIEPGGSLVFDVNTEYAFKMKMFDQENKRANAKLRYEWKGDWDPLTRLIVVHMKFWLADQEFEEVHVQRAYSDDEIREMLLQAGFAKVGAFHSYTLDKPRAKSDRVHYVAIRS